MPSDQLLYVLHADNEQVSTLMQRLSHHFEMLCFTDKTLPWYLTTYKWMLYGILWTYQHVGNK
jgi:hypothetical protein